MDKKRPVIVIVAVVLGITVGAFGILGGCMGVFGQVMQSASVSALEQMAQGNPALQPQVEMQRAMLAVQEPFQVPMIVGQVFNLLASILLIVGAALLAALKRSAFMVLIAASISCVLVDLFNGALGMYMSVAMQPAIEAQVAQMAQMPGQDPAMLGAATSAGGTIGLVFGLFILVVKLVVYALEVWAARDANQAQLLT